MDQPQRRRTFVFELENITPEDEDKLQDLIADAIESLGLKWHMVLSKPDDDKKEAVDGK